MGVVGNTAPRRSLTSVTSSSPTYGNSFKIPTARDNRRIAKPRARVEHVLAGLVQLSGKVLRSIGLALATLHLNRKAAAYNLRRLSYLKQAQVDTF